MLSYLYGICYPAYFILCGCSVTRALLYRRPGILRVTVGTALGCVMMMWFPFLFACFGSFDIASQLFALIPASAAGAAGAFFAFRRRTAPFWGDIKPLPFLLSTVPFWLLMAYLLVTHTLLPDAEGNLHVGQSTYGDLSLHIGIATGLVNSPCPPDYTILTGELLGYPFLGDAMAATLMVLGTGVQFTFILTALIMLAAVFSASWLFFYEMTGSTRASVIAQCLLYLTGGLGFIYSIEGCLQDPSKIKNVFTAFYQAPANLPDKNIYWVNVLCDSLLPQRTLLAGWCILIPCLILLKSGVDKKDRSSLLLFGAMAGALPMIHTHSFLALFLISLGTLLRRIMHHRVRDTIRLFLPCVIIAGALSVPQVLVWTLPQSTAQSVICFRPGWMDQTGTGLKEGLFWFYLKNVGPSLLFILPGILSSERRSSARSLALGAGIIFVIANLFLFQRNPFDNNKLLLVSYIVCVPFAAKCLCDIWDRLSGLPGRSLLALFTGVVCTLSAFMSIGRECVSDYRLYSAADVRAAEWIDENTERDAVFLTGTGFIDPVSVLAGRHIVCGPDLYLYYHGFDTTLRRAQVKMMYESPAESRALFERYGIGYVYLSGSEYMDYNVDAAWFESECELVYDTQLIRVYRISSLGSH